jgi:predicted aspartyl protease
MKVCTFLAACVAIGLALASNVAAQTPKCKLVRIAEWPVRAKYHRPVVDGEINGQKIGILIDTGAERSLIRRSATTRLGLTRHEVEGYRGFGVGGETRLESVLLDEFKIGRAVRKNWRLLVVGEHDFGDDIAFILGDDFLHQADIEFDLANNAITLYEAKDCEGVSLAYWTRDPGVVPIEADGEIRLTIAINGKPVRAQLDSGAGSSILASVEAARLGVTQESPGAVAAGCVGGVGRNVVDSWIGQFESVAIGNEVIRNPKLRFADLWRHTTYTETGSRLPTPIAGLPQMVLGADFLRAHRVLIAHSQRKMYFTYTGGTVFPTVPGKGCNAQGDR